MNKHYTYYGMFPLSLNMYFLFSKYKASKYTTYNLYLLSKQIFQY